MQGTLQCNELKSLLTCLMNHESFKELLQPTMKLVWFGDPNAVAEQKPSTHGWKWRCSLQPEPAHLLRAGDSGGWQCVLLHVFVPTGSLISTNPAQRRDLNSPHLTGNSTKWPTEVCALLEKVIVRGGRKRKKPNSTHYTSEELLTQWPFRDTSYITSWKNSLPQGHINIFEKL